MKQVPTIKKSLVLSSSLYQIINLPRFFSKYRLVLLLLCITMIISSCHKEDEHVKKTVPFKAKFKTVEVPFSDTEDQVTGTGTGIPIGNSNFVAYVNFVNFPSVKGTSTLTTENGDQIFTTFSGSVAGPDNDTLRITNTNTITGGTGKFAGATGSFIAHGIVNTKLPPEAPATLTNDGTITY
jgi:hypothetical protein